MSKRRKRKKRRGALPDRAKRSRYQSSQSLQAALDRADDLISDGRAQAAIELLEPFLEFHSRKADLHYYLGYARAKSGDTWAALPGYERAQELSKDPSYWSILASLYLEVGLRIHALRALRQAIKHQNDFPLVENMHNIAAALERDLAEIADRLDRPVSQTEEGLYRMERGRRALAETDYPAAITTSRNAIKLLGDWPPPHNNLSLALFWSGQPEEAIAIARRVLLRYPDNIHALGNAIRYLAWTGREDEARDLWDRLKIISPSDDDLRRKIVEAAAILDEDEYIYQLLRPLAGVKPGPARTDRPFQVSAREHFHLAVAEANTGRRRDARRRLQALRRDWSGADDLLQSLEAKEAGAGWSDRFPYFHSSALVPKDEMKKLIELAQRRSDLPVERFRREMEQLVARFPQVIRMAEKMILEENQPDAGISILSNIGTTEAYDALRRFALSQVGEDDVRTNALTRLIEAGEISEDDTMRVWLDGEWHEVQLKIYEHAEDDEAYSPKVADLVNRGISAQQKGDDDLAEQLFQQALELDPEIKQAYNNLGTVYAHRGEHGQARKMFQKALELDPLYPIPRCNLAIYLLDDGDVESAEAMFEPILNAPPHYPKDVAFYWYTQARILLDKGEYAAARRALRAALKALPDYKPAQDLLERLDQIIPLLTGFEGLFTRYRERAQAKRVRMQTMLTTSAPTLSEALSIYTKDALTGMARVILPYGGWSALHKAELLQRIVEALSDPNALESLVNELGDDERAALRQVLANGGTMPWKDFEARYGSDVEESSHWGYGGSETTMGRLRLHGLLAETTVDKKLLVSIPVELRHLLQEILD